jgi:hypothetical protein
MDTKITFSLQGMYEAILPPAKRTLELTYQYKYNILYIIRHYIHPDLKSEYVMEMESNNIWSTLQTRYEQQKVVILPEANQDWNHLRLHDYKSIADHNHVVHKICTKLRFCEKEPYEGDKIEKTLHMMLPSVRILQHRYCVNNY